jgi:lipid-binding SYLF domain-containing protein
VLTAGRSVESFVDNGNNGLDGVVPRAIIERAKGFAIFSVVKAGFVFSARAGSGIVIARLDDGCAFTRVWGSVVIAKLQDSVFGT